MHGNVLGGDASDVVQYSPQGQDVAKRFPTQMLPQQFEEVGSGRVAWTEVCFIQYLSVRVAQVKDVVAVTPQIQLFASVGVRHRRVKAKGPVDEDAHIARGKTIDVEAWRPPTQKEYNKIIPREVHERPSEGIIIAFKQHKKLHLTKQRIAHVEGRGFDIIKCGNRGDSGATSAPPDDMQDDGSDVDGWPARKHIKYVRERIAKFAKGPPIENAPLTAPVLDSPGGWSQEEFDVDEDGGHNAWVNWKQELVKVSRKYYPPAHA